LISSELSWLVVYVNVRHDLQFSGPAPMHPLEPGITDLKESYGDTKDRIRRHIASTSCFRLRTCLGDTPPRTSLHLVTLYR
jgi:hypothetical protein